jgi:5-methylcytosine-specific restriction endonuclease McrA
MKRYQKIYDRYDYRCVYCKHPLWEDFRIWHSAVEDHLYPQSKKHNGSNSDANLVAACQLCNSLKGDFVPKPFADQEGVLVKNNGKYEVNVEFLDEYIRLVTAKIEERRATRETEFNLERKRKNT